MKRLSKNKNVTKTFHDGILIKYESKKCPEFGEVVLKTSTLESFYFTSPTFQIFMVIVNKLYLKFSWLEEKRFSLKQLITQKPESGDVEPALLLLVQYSKKLVHTGA